MWPDQNYRFRGEVQKRKYHIRNAVMALLALAAVAVVYIYNPTEVNWMPKCVIFTLTGYRCPSCGSTRAVHALLHGNVNEALNLNPLMPVLLALAAAIIYRLLRRDDSPSRLTIGLLCAFVAVYIVWGVTRNILGV